MKLSLKKVRVFESLSEETICFSADLYDDGKFISEVSNRGRGGSNDFSNYTTEIAKKYDTLDVECDIMTMVERYNIVTKKQSKGWVLSKDGQIYTQKFPYALSRIKKNSKFNEWFIKNKTQFKADGYEVLNRNL